MSRDRVRVVLTVDPVSGQVTCEERSVDLCPDTRIVSTDGQLRTLGEIAAAYTLASDIASLEKAFPPEVQHAIGEVLYQALGADTFDRSSARWLEIAVDDGGSNSQARLFLERLPWALTAVPSARSLGFLVQNELHPWVITLDGDPGRIRPDQLFPPEPRLLLMIPEQDASTEGTEHRGEIAQILRTHYTSEALATNVKIVSTWPEACRLIDPASGFNPTVIYFYGHGESGLNSTSLTFDPVTNELNTVEAHAIGLLLGRLAEINRPALFVANCCHGTSANRASLGEEIASKVACLITNRSVMDTQAAREFGFQILRSVIAEGAPPDIFMRDATTRVIERVANSSCGGRWACPVVYTNYARWIVLAPTQRRRDLRRRTAGGFVERVDRRIPLAMAETALRPALAAQATTLQAFVWHSEQAQGGATFSRRLRDEILERFTDTAVSDVVVELQPDAYAEAPEGKRRHLLAGLRAALCAPGRRAEAVLLDEAETLSDSVLNLLEARLANRGIVLLLRLVPVPIGKPASQDLIRTFWRVWIELREELMRRASQDKVLRIVLAIALETERGGVIEVASLLRRTGDPLAEVVMLGELASVTVDDLVQHFSDFPSAYDNIDSEVREDRAAAIHKETNGVFLPTQLHLKIEANIT